ncbi:hypothetical protein [Streptomyces sp. NBC_00328]|uniref:hypothetical protein n=1 Tax=Streptomyces sp. NBC_00328 TaxID=2903646 RepID=UPI002E2B41A0|nr:hypothetical protein [Streptomyces sp. NBC_00328]
MEQRIGSKSQPLDAAAVNPAYIPGLTSPVPAEPKDAVAKTEEAVAEETVSDETVSEDAASDEAASDEAPAAETPKESESEEEAASEADPESEADLESEAVPDGPVFEASDRRASIRADHSGVRLRLDDQEAEFRWDEIGAVETESPRFGKRFTITVHTPERRWYPIEIEANARARFKEWEEQLDAVLDAYFEDGEPETETEPETAAEVEVTAEAEAEVEAETAAEAEVEDDKGEGKSEKP